MTDIIGSALNVVLGASAGQVSQNYTYALIATELGALLRIDIDIYSFELRSKGLQEKAKNMTAITSIVSSIDSKDLTVNDLRSIVSMTFGSSPLDRQKAIYDVIMAAWTEANTNGGRPKTTTNGAALGGQDVAIDVGLSPESRQRVQSLFVPSVYESDMTRRGLIVDGVIRMPVAHTKPPAVGREELLAVVSKKAGNNQATDRVARMSLADNGDVTADGKAPPAGKDPTDWIDILIWVKVLSQPDRGWLARFAAALTGFNAPGAFEYVEIFGGRSGSAVTFRCKAISDPEAFDMTVRYCNDTVVPSLTSSPYLAAGFVAGTALQYAHPSQDGTGLVTRVVFKNNTVINTTSDATITFHASAVGKPILTLAPGASALLAGSVHHLTVEPVADDENPPQATQWVTYQVLQKGDIIMGAAASLAALPKGGYRISMYSANDEVINVDFGEQWVSQSAM